MDDLRDLARPAQSSESLPTTTDAPACTEPDEEPPAAPRDSGDARERHRAKQRELQRSPYNGRVHSGRPHVRGDRDETAFAKILRSSHARARAKVCREERRTPTAEDGAAQAILGSLAASGLSVRSCALAARIACTELEWWLSINDAGGGEVVVDDGED